MKRVSPLIVLILLSQMLLCFSSDKTKRKRFLDTEAGEPFYSPDAFLNHLQDWKIWTSILLLGLVCACTYRSRVFQIEAAYLTLFLILFFPEFGVLAIIFYALWSYRHHIQRQIIFQISPNASRSLECDQNIELHEHLVKKKHHHKRDQKEVSTISYVPYCEERPKGARGEADSNEAGSSEVGSSEVGSSEVGSSEVDYIEADSSDYDTSKAKLIPYHEQLYPAIFKKLEMTSMSVGDWEIEFFAKFAFDYDTKRQLERDGSLNKKRGLEEPVPTTNSKTNEKEEQKQDLQVEKDEDAKDKDVKDKDAKDKEGLIEFDSKDPTKRYKVAKDARVHI